MAAAAPAPPLLQQLLLLRTYCGLMRGIIAPTLPMPMPLHLLMHLAGELQVGLVTAGVTLRM